MPRQTRREFLRACARLGALALGGSAAWSLARGRGEAAEFQGGVHPGFEPAYLAVHKSGKLKRRYRRLFRRMRRCDLCPRACGANRAGGETGECGAASRVRVSHFEPSFGEEKGLVGKGGSGKIYFSNCALRCKFCVNWEFSLKGQGKDHDVEKLADMMIRLQWQGCQNIHLVTPGPYSPHILRAVDIAVTKGLRLPLVYNTSGWERPDVLKALRGAVDVYLPDFKFADASRAAKYCPGGGSYPKVVRGALLEMQKQVGTAKPEKDGIVRRGLMIRHLVMPGDVGNAKKVTRWIGENLPADTYVRLVDRYRPMYKAFDHKEISREITRDEYRDAVLWAKEAGLTNLDVRGGRPVPGFLRAPSRGRGY